MLSKVTGNLVIMQNVAKNKRKNVQMESNHAVKVVKMEIENIRIKDQIEETFLRFPHIGEQILENLDDQCLFECQKISRPWQDFITENRILPIALLHKCTHLPKRRLKKSVRKYDIKTVQNLVICAIETVQKLVIPSWLDVPLYNKFAYDNSNWKLVYVHLFNQKPLKTIQYLFVEVILQNVMHPNITKLEDKRFNDFLREVAICKEHNFFWCPIFGGPEDEKDLVFSWNRILFVAVYYGHFSVCKFVTEKVKDIHKASTKGEILITTANENGYHDIFRLLENSFRIKK